MTEKNVSTELTKEEMQKRIRELEIDNAILQGDQDNYGIRLDEYINVMSLVPHKLNLSTEELGRGRKFSFTRFGEVKRILYNDLASILEHYRSFMESGYFYIMSKKVVRKHGLDDIYDSILDKDKMEQVLSCNSKEVMTLYKSTTDKQRDVIDRMLIQKLKDGEDLDLNLISQISKFSNKDLQELAQDAKFNDELSKS